MTYLELIKKCEKQAKLAKMDVGAIKWMFFYSDFHIGYTHLNEVVDNQIAEQFQQYVNLYIHDKMPPQYILKKACFYGYDFYVDEHVFIPRNETEQLVEECILRIDRYFENQPIEVADVCCGSGIIGITIKKEVDNAHVLLCDINEKAIEIVQKNATQLQVKVDTEVGDFITPLLQKKVQYDVLICNPPYIRNDAILDEIVVEHEPNNALFGGVDGLDFYRIIFEHFEELIKEKGFMAFEFGYDQKAELKALIEEKLPQYRYEFLKDYASLDRMLFIYKGF